MDEGYYEINQIRKNYPIKVVPHEAILENGAFVAQHWHRSIEIVLVRGDSPLFFRFELLVRNEAKWYSFHKVHAFHSLENS